MICKCSLEDFNGILCCINDGAEAYRGVIPDDCWQEPYMSPKELKEAIKSGVIFWSYKKHNKIIGVMGLQQKKDVSLIRHAYVKTAYQRKGIGSKLLKHLFNKVQKTLLVGTWEKAGWAIKFYQKHNFKLVSPKEKNELLKKYWDISKKQRKNSVVLRKIN